MARLKRVAVVGAGIAGLACARRLSDAGVEVAVFDKGRKVGGRMATRQQAGRQLDHGAQFFTAESEAFRQAVAGWLSVGVVAEWNPLASALSPRTRYVGRGMNRALPEYLARDLDVTLETEIAPLRGGGELCTADGTSLGRYDHIVVTAPTAQAARLVAPLGLDLLLSRGSHAPCWAVLVELVSRPCAEDILLKGGPLAWMACDSSKPGRPPGETWVLHASPQWSRAHLELAREAVAERLVRAFATAIGAPIEPTFAVAHRWRYAQVEQPIGQRCLHDGKRGVTIAGDGMIAPRVEAAWQSGTAAAKRILAA
jgi:renalase